LPHAEALAHLRAGRPQAAAALLSSVVDSSPTDAGAWFLLGACRHALNDLPAAAEAFSRSLLLNPGNAEAHYAHVTVLRALGRKHAALAAGRKAVDHFPSDARAIYAMALCLEDLGQLDEALAHYDTALSVDPAFEDALHNRGLLLLRLDRVEEAEVNQRQYVALRPHAARAHSVHADALLSLGRFEDALRALDEVERLSPADIAARVRRGVALAALRRFADARRVMTDARVADPSAVAAYLGRVSHRPDPEAMLCPENIFLWHAWRRLGECDWLSWDECVKEMARVATQSGLELEPAVAFICRLLPLSGAQRHAVVRKVSARIESKFPTLPPAPERKRRHLRVGVLSPDFREHLNAYLLRPLFELADRSRFEIFAYSLAVDDGSQARASVRDAADAFRDLQPLSDSEAALAIRDDNVDVLLDVGGHTTDARFAITAQRPARVQVNYLGFSCSLASTRVDYAIVDRVAGGDGDEWTEARVFIPDTHFLYDYRSETPQAPVTRRDYGLPEDAFVFCAFHRAEKISPDVFELWMRILARVPNSVLWFRALTERTARNLRAQAEAYAIAPARLVFAPFEPSTDPRYLSRHRLGDLMLDALHHNATTTACDALGAGLPLLTLPGSAMAARMGESLVRAAGLPELVVQDRDGYVETAVRLACNRAALREATDRLRSNRKRAPLFDTAGRVRALEAAFQGMYDRMMRGERPASFDV
jgi:predicted O-linked N-acetylglucosamine transferase (SPINDLY family)